MANKVKISQIDLFSEKTILEKEIQTPFQPGQVYSYQGIPGVGDFSSDITPSLIVQTQGIFTFGFDVIGQEIEYQGMTFIPHKDDMGHVIGIDIRGKAGTSVKKRKTGTGELISKRAPGRRGQKQGSEQDLED